MLAPKGLYNYMNGCVNQKSNFIYSYLRHKIQKRIKRLIYADSKIGSIQEQKVREELYFIINVSTLVLLFLSSQKNLYNIQNIYNRSISFKVLFWKPPHK